MDRALFKEVDLFKVCKNLMIYHLVIKINFSYSMNIYSNTQNYG